MTSPGDPFDIDIRLRRELLAQGYHDRAIDQLVRSGVLVRFRRGAYALATEWAPLDSDGQHIVETLAVLKRANTDAVPSHASAVPFWLGPTWGLDLSRIHTTRLDGKTGRNESGVRQHRGRVLAEDVGSCHGHAVMAPTRTAIEVSTVSTIESSVIVLNDFLHRGLTTPEKVRARYEATMEHWPDSRASEVVIRLGHPKIASVLESRFWCFCYFAGLPAPIPQFEVHHPDGRVAAVLDFAWPEFGAYVETNGKAKYLELLKKGEKPGDVIQRERRREELVHELARLRPIHVVWADLETPRKLDQRVRDLLSTPRVIVT